MPSGVLFPSVVVHFQQLFITHHLIILNKEGKNAADLCVNTCSSFGRGVTGKMAVVHTSLTWSGLSFWLFIEARHCWYYIRVFLSFFFSGSNDGWSQLCYWIQFLFRNVIHWSHRGTLDQYNSSKSRFILYFQTTDDIQLSSIKIKIFAGNVEYNNHTYLFLVRGYALKQMYLRPFFLIIPK